MRITFILPHANLSGGTRVVAIYSRKLTERGHRVCVGSVTPPKPRLADRLRRLVRGNGFFVKGAREASHLDGLPIEHRVLPHPGPVRDSEVPDADVTIATWWETAEWVAALGPAKGAKAYFIQHD